VSLFGEAYPIMPIKFQCPVCYKELTAPDEAAGRGGKCPRCGEKVKVPEAEKTLSKGAKKAIAQFHRDIKQYEEGLFAITLFYDTMSKLWRWTNTVSYNNIMRRGREALTEAKILLEIAKKSPDKCLLLENFYWLPIKAGGRGWEHRLDLLLRTYRRRFPGRPMERLSSDEAKLLRDATMQQFKIWGR